MKAGQVEEKIEYFPVGDIHPSKNYRKTMDKGKMDELIASVKAEGIQTPIWVRSNGSGWLLVAGERRLKAAIAAGLAKIPSIVKNVKTEQEALELSVIENDQREDVNPMEQAMGYKDLLDKGKHTPETLAQKLGKGVPYVLGRLKLLNIPKEAQKALLDGKIEFGHALLMTRLKNNGDQKKFLEDIMDKWEPLSVTQAKDHLNQYSLKLTAAAFDSKACATCTFRSKAQAGLFPEAAKSADECMDKSCFFTKTREHYQKLAKEMEAKGLKVLTTIQAVQKAKAAPNACEISPDPEDSWKHPKKYKSMCAPCDKRTFFCYEDDHQGYRKSFETGEICLDKKCFNKMNNKQDHSGGSSRTSDGRPRSNAGREHALAMRDRFLRTRMPAKVEANETLQRRILLFHFLCRFDRFAPKPELKKDQDQTLADILREHCPAWKHESLLDEQKLFAAISMIPAVSLGAVTRKAVLASVVFTEEEVLLQGMGESGLSFEKDFRVDEAFLVTKTKAELSQLMKKSEFGFGHAATTVMQGKKTDMVKWILQQGPLLTGKVPSEVAKECKLISFGGTKVKAKKAKKK